MPQYSQKVMEHFMNPRNVGEIPDADGIGEVGNPVCGDMMTFYIKVSPDGERIEDVKYKTFGCGAAIAVSSMVSEMAKGKTIDEALKITRESVAQELGGLPPNKMHCSNLGADALHKAIENYLSKKSKKTGTTEQKKGSCKCPFCNFDLPCSNEEEIYCSQCKIKLDRCPKCGNIIELGKICPYCEEKK